MNKLLAFIAALVLSSIQFSLAYAQASYSMPRAIKLDSIVRRSFPGFYVRAYRGGPIQQLYTEGFYPIGWSRDGKFAYYNEPVDEECGCYYAELTIQDLHDDAVLWNFDNKPQERMDEKGEIIPDDMVKLWKRNQTMFDNKLHEHTIEQTRTFTLLPATFNSGGKSYTARVSVLKGSDGDGLRRVRKVTVELSSPTLGKKTLYFKDYTNDMYVSPLDMAVAGVFKSPVENRAAIVLVNVQRGWEGPPHTVDVRIVGADLEKGFRK